MRRATLDCRVELHLVATLRGGQVDDIELVELDDESKALAMLVHLGGSLRNAWAEHLRLFVRDDSERPTSRRGHCAKSCTAHSESGATMSHTPPPHALASKTRWC